jgi:hypothetical protein
MFFFDGGTHSPALTQTQQIHGSPLADFAQSAVPEIKVSLPNFDPTTKFFKQQFLSNFSVQRFDSWHPPNVKILILNIC